jgi:AhpD family alkylhydroperoxidase
VGILTEVNPAAASRAENTPMSTPSASYLELTQSVSKNLATLRADIPETMKGFNDLARAATSDGALDKKTKELIALALGVAAHCDACIGFHMKALVKLGATKAEVEEALGMAVYMGGGPSLMYSANAVAAFNEFSAAAVAA